MARRVTGPDGRTWIVRRHWLARLPVWIGPRPKPAQGSKTSPASKGWNGLDFLGDLVWFSADVPAAVLIGIALILLAFLAVPIVIFLLDAVLIGLIALVVLLARVLFRRPWLVIAETAGPPPIVHRWSEPGWRASAERIERVAVGLEAGSDVTPAR